MRSTALALASIALVSTLGCADGSPTGPGSQEAPDSPALALATVAGTGKATSLYSLVAPDRCMDVTGASRNADTRVITWRCNAQPNQTWQWLPSGEIRVYGSMCLDASGARGRDGDPIIIWWCNGGPNQRWRATAAGEIRGMNDRCVTVAGNSTAAGAPLELRNCIGATGQKWDHVAPGSQPAPVATVAVSPATATLAPGATTQLTVVLRDAAGNTLTNRSVTWSTANAAVATVSTTGLVTAVAAGSATITATSEGRAGGAAITVSAPAPTLPPPGGGTTIFSDGFESGTLGLWQDGVDPARHRVITDAARARSGSRLLEVTFPAGSDGGWLGRFFMPGYDSVRVSAWIQFPTDWTGDTRFLRLGGSRIDNQWSGIGTGGRCPQGTDFFNSAMMFDYANGALDPMRFYSYWVGMPPERDGVTCWGRFDAGSNTTYHSPLSVAKNRWHRVDFWLKLNTPGRSDGVQRFWLNGELKGEWRNMNFRSTTDLRLNWLQLTFRSGQTSTVARRLYIDDVVVDANAPGGLSAEPAPEPPAPAPVASVTVSPSSSTLAIGASTQLAATTLDGSGGVLTGRTVSWTSSNALVATVSSTGFVTALTSGTATITATSEGRSGTASVTVPAPSTGLAPTITSISRDAGTTAGGTTLIVSGGNFDASTEVLFGGIAARSVALLGATQLRVVTPPRNTGTVSVVVRNGSASATLANAFEYLPAPATVFVRHGFEDGRSGPFGFWQTSVTTEAARSGTYSAKSVVLGTSQSADITFRYTSPRNPAASEANGIYQRWYVMLPQSSITNTAASGQIKLHLSRYNEDQGSSLPGWFMMGIGAQFGSRTIGQITAWRDYGLTELPGTFTQGIVRPGQWHEIQVWYRRSGGRGHVRLWVDGKKQIDTSDPLFGTDDTSAQMSYRIGIAYTQGNSGPVTTYVDDAAAANGYLEP